MWSRKTIGTVALACSILLPGFTHATDRLPTCTDRYHTEAQFLANPDESLLIAQIIGWCRKNKTSLLWDERYAIAARRWSEHLKKSGLSTQRMLPVDRLRFELRMLGVTDARFEPYSVEGPVGEQPEGMLQFLDRETKSGRFTHFAVGVDRTRNQKRMVTTLLLGRRPVLIEPLPVCPLPADRLLLRLRLRHKYRHPTWLLTYPGGSVISDNLLYQEGAWHATVPLDGGKGAYQMEVLVHGPAGPEVAALFPLFVGVKRPRLPVVKLHAAPARYRTPEDAEKSLVRMLNRERSRYQLPALVVDDSLNQVAQDYSMQLLNRRHAVHHTPKTGSLQDRLRRSGIPFVRALENVSLSSSPEIAHRRFMESPSHRMNILDPNATHLGVGIAMERGSEKDILAVCEILIERPESLDASKTVRRLAQLINRTRRNRGRFALGLDEELSRLALRSARRLVAEGNQADPKREGNRLVEHLTDNQLEIPAVRVCCFLTTNLRRVLSCADLLDEEINRVGIGVAKAQRRNKPDELWISLIFAGR